MRRPIIEEDYKKQRLRISRRLAALKSFERKRLHSNKKERLSEVQENTCIRNHGNIQAIFMNTNPQLNDDCFTKLLYIY